ncbi:hypothetical protein N657DRAFT_641745 [Parathielavia appendiculata]|uniref:Uncharacterized protein n=1 Tax=Parathielavia appendiculata TaxID=2587402 RepID=A0AAN6U9Z7_9PEZI|nr:hypothetical protein N657DRAFT_641745 [Parathielavia appendiculata]
MPRSTSTISPRRRSLPRSEHRTPAGHLGCTCQRACIWNGGICRPCRRPDESQTSNTSRSPSLAPMYPIALTHMHREASPDPQSPEKPRPGLLGLPGPACSTPPAAFSNLTGPRLYIKRRSAQQLQQATPGFGVEHDGRPSKTDLPLLLPMAIYEMAALFLHHIHA